MDHYKSALECIYQLKDPEISIQTKQILVQAAIVHAILDVSSKLSGDDQI